MVDAHRHRQTQTHSQCTRKREREREREHESQSSENVARAFIERKRAFKSSNFTFHHTKKQNTHTRALTQQQYDVGVCVYRKIFSRKLTYANYVKNIWECSLLTCWKCLLRQRQQRHKHTLFHAKFNQSVRHFYFHFDFQTVPAAAPKTTTTTTIITAATANDRFLIFATKQIEKIYHTKSSKTEPSRKKTHKTYLTISL